MARQRSSSARVRSVRPSLECLEERNLLSNAGFVGALTDFHQTIQNNQSQLRGLARTINDEVKAFNANPKDVGATINLVANCLAFIEQTGQLAAQVNLYNNVVALGGAFGLLTGDVAPFGIGDPIDQAVGAKLKDTDAFPHDVLDAQLELAQFQGQAGAAATDILQSLSTFLSGGSSNLPPFLTDEGSPSSPPASPPAGVTENIADAPKTAPANGGPVTESVTVQNPTNSDVHVAINYTSTDGSTASASDDCTNSTVTVPLQVNPSAAGNVGTWTVAVTGEPNQTNTTSFV